MYLSPTGIPTYNNNDGKGPRIDLCCLPGSDCLVTDPNYNSRVNFPYTNGASSQHEGGQTTTEGRLSAARL